MTPQPQEVCDPPEASAQEHVDTLLDRALEDTFPASDPFGILVD